MVKRAKKQAASSIEELTRAAEGGDPAAQERLALTYMEGWGVPVDHAKAHDWYARAAAQDDPGGHFGLAVLHLLGPAGPRDPVEAYMRLLLMDAHREILPKRWSRATARKMEVTLKDLEAKLSETERKEGRRRAQRWRPGD